MDDDVKCSECVKQGYSPDATTNAHCLECVHCENHCASLYEDCLCCCVEGHCDSCLWHSSDEECDPFECSCCCNDHCIACGHENPEICEDEGNKCSCCGCWADQKPDTKKANNIDSGWLAILKGDHTSKINPKHLGPKDILKDIGLFYILLAHGDKKMLDTHKKLLAQRMLNYLLVSCAGEARHVLSKTNADITKLSQMSQTILSAQNVNTNLGNRQYMWSAMYDLAQVSGYGVIMASLEEMFNLHWLTNSYGGKKWAKIAQLANNYCDGEYTESIFIDGIMNVVHNGGWAFNKYYKAQSGGNYYNPGITMMKLLDYKKEATLKSIYALLVPLSIPKEGNESLWKKALEYEVVDETGELTSKYGLPFKKDSTQKTFGGYIPPVQVKVPSLAYIEYVKQHTKEVVSVA